MKRTRISAVLAALWFAIAHLSLAHADETITLIHEVIGPDAGSAHVRGGDLTLVLLTSGRVLRVSDGESLKHIEELEQAMRDGTPLRIEFEEVNGRDVIHEVSEVPLSREQRLFLEEFGEFPAGDLPGESGARDDWWEDDPWSEMPSEDVTGTRYSTTDLYRYMSGMRLRRSAQCFHRAYLWAYDTWRYRGTSTQKVFLFFTQRYLREYGYGWWFHVAPYVNSSSGETVLDPTFTTSPRRMRSWTNVFMKGDQFCPTIHRYSGWTNHHRDQYCYLRKTNMYYYHPNRIERADKGGYVINQWDRAGLNNSQVARP